jgi:hypothetical protein
MAGCEDSELSRSSYLLMEQVLLPRDIARMPKTERRLRIVDCYVDVAVGVQEE